MQVELWKKIQRENFTHWGRLAEYLCLSEEDRKELIVHQQFPLNLPARLAAKIDKGTLNDPIFKQFIPTTQENVQKEEFVLDPVGDSLSQKAPKLIHKYQGRVLLVCTSACAMHCRYCFRKNFDYAVLEKGFAEELEYIRRDSSIREVILSGGDPLSLQDKALEGLVLAITSIPHVKHLRIHSRFLIGIPERITAPFLEIFRKLPVQKWFVIHTNHPKELDADVESAIKSLQRAGFQVLNQSVLLRGVNDSADILTELSQRLIDIGVIPYYLHQLDKVSGSHHFEVSSEQGKVLVAEMRQRLPGYAVPEFVQEIAGEESKTPILG